VSQVRKQLLGAIPRELETCTSQGLVSATVSVPIDMPVGSECLEFVMDRHAKDKTPCTDGVVRSERTDFFQWLLRSEDWVAHAHTVIPEHVATVLVIQQCNGKSFKIKADLVMAGYKVYNNLNV
jgi:hypothetical protein